jgi:hypothetical protein
MVLGRFTCGGVVQVSEVNEAAARRQIETGMRELEEKLHASIVTVKAIDKVHKVCASPSRYAPQSKA